MSHNHTSRQRARARALLPCESPPGSPGRIQTYRLRARFRLPVFNSRDVQAGDGDVLIPVFASNHELMARHLACARRDGLIVVQTAPELSEPPRSMRPSIVALKDTPAFRAREAERKRRERARKRRDREERLPAA